MSAAPRLRVMHVLHGMDVGGAERVVLEHVRHAAADVESIVCATHSGGRSLEEAARLGARTLVLSRAGGRAGALARLAAFLRRERVAVVNGHNVGGGVFAALAGRLAGVPAIVRTEHSTHHPGRHAALYDRLLEPPLTALTHRVVCVCAAVRDRQRARTPWAGARLALIRNGISEVAGPTDRDATRAALGLAADEVAVLTVASLTPAKAQDVLVEAFALAARTVSGARLLLAGDGPLRAGLEERARRHGLGDRVRFLGVREDVPALYAAADLFVLSSVREGLSLSLLEAMRAGRAAVATDVGGNGEAVVPGETGLVVPVGDVAALARALAELAADGARREAWGKAARRRWEENFTAEHMVRETEALYRGLLSATRS